MSRVRTYSNLSDISDEVQFYPDPDERPAKMPRYGSSQSTYGSVPMRYSRRVASQPSRRRRSYKSRVPRAISTRGTPRGYYEIPVKVFWKLYVNTSSGACVTDPATGVQSGAIGYLGMAVSHDYSSVTVDLGNNAFTTNFSVNIPGVGELQSVFDLCKMYKVDYEFWWTNGLNQAPTASNVAGAPELWVANDYNGGNPPGTNAALLQYSDMMRCPSDPTKRYYKTCYPRQRVVLGTSADPAATTSVVAGSQASTYFETDKPSVRHTGLLGYLQLPQNIPGPVQQYYINCMMTIHRRFKVTR